ncbi:hypothetical protein JRQ81_004376 [Phrynocephalus forsythii]|uniref:G-protein coupled receptors family 3 profile domain-containing protein n=1 Tax=Phrynocephalus forsythii TaxID=171643 RepID=A0A9Q1AV63_9SAUR|nr:hypothetical protein JRQ81_004376 [Phrynocephalus forsythii]
MESAGNGAQHEPCSLVIDILMQMGPPLVAVISYFSKKMASSFQPTSWRSCLCHYVFSFVQLSSQSVCEVDTLKCQIAVPIPVSHELYQSGDLVIGGVVAQFICCTHEFSFKECPWQEFSDLNGVVMKFYQHVLSFVFAVKEVNESPKILPNASIGLHIHDSYNNALLTYRSTLGLLFKSRRFVPNYACNDHSHLIAVLGAYTFRTSLHILHLCSFFKIPQLTYGSFATARRDAAQDLSLYHMAPNESHLQMGIIHLLKHFKWVWIGLFVVNDDTGEWFLKTLEPLMSENGICSDFTRKIPTQENLWSQERRDHIVRDIHLCLSNKKSRIVVLYGDTYTFLWMQFFMGLGVLSTTESSFVGKVWILTPQIEVTFANVDENPDLRPFQGAISLMIHSAEVPGFRKFLENIKVSWANADDFVLEFWGVAFDCFLPVPKVSYKVSGSCTGEERLESIPGTLFEMRMTGHSYSIYNAVYAVAHALHALGSSRAHYRTKVQSVLQDISFNNSAGELVSFSANRPTKAGFDIMNMFLSPNQSLQKVKVGWASLEELILDDKTITWHPTFNQVWTVLKEKEACSDTCHPGYWKRKKEGEKFCCYDCDKCPKGKISNRSNMLGCFQCPEDQYPSKERDRCISKVITFLTYEEPLGKCLTALAVSLSLITVMVLGTFIKHKDTPIVKANNRDLTYALLISLFLCFLSSFLFLGEPGKLTCLLQEMFFFTAFSVALSCVLAKTIVVVTAFMAAKPGSSLRKWLGKRVGPSIVFCCSLLQVGICAIWLGTFPPFQDLDKHSATEEIFMQCNMGSNIMFYLVLGYLGLLSSFNLTVAFLAKNLPDTFNEAKFITFSMLMFFSILLSFVPVYLSTKGKQLMAVEIFYLLASSAALLGCIFGPKCYILLFKPEVNTREQLRKKYN